MDFLKNLFGNTQEEVWSQLAKYIGASYVRYENPKDNTILYKHKQWEIALDTTIINNTRYTQMRLPFLSKSECYFHLYEESLFSIENLLGLSNIRTGDKAFDKKFVIKCNKKAPIKQVFASSEIRELSQMIKSLNVEVQKEVYPVCAPDAIDPIPEYYADQLYYSRVGVLKDKDQLFYLFKLFSLIIDQLLKIDAVYNDNPGFELLD